MWNFLKKSVGFLLFGIVFLLVSMKLFLPDVYDQWNAQVFGIEEHASGERNKIVIAYPESFQGLDPDLNDVTVRSRLLNIYEPLVRMDKDLRLVPGLAKTWGALDDYTWEFTLRQGIKFHDESEVTTGDVRASILRARDHPDSTVSSLVSKVESVDIVDDGKIRIKTKFPDPLIVNKLTMVYIFPAEKAEQIALQPIGTGPYFFKSWDPEEKVLELERFKNYWGGRPKYDYVSIRTIESKEGRSEAIRLGEIDLLASVPPAMIRELEMNDIRIVRKPSLEVNFLMFNFKPFQGENAFAQRQVREAVYRAMNTTQLLRYLDSYLQPATQFVSQGIFGFNPTITGFEYDLDEAVRLVREVESFFRVQVTLDLPQGLEALGNYVNRQLSVIGIDVDLNYLSADDLQQKVLSGQSQFYFLGWRSELGDASDFYQSVIHSRTLDGQYGRFNGANYHNVGVDVLVEESERNMDEVLRLKQLQTVMQVIVEEDVLGVPLFEPEAIYGLARGIKWEPRVDGYIYAVEIT